MVSLHKTRRIVCKLRQDPNAGEQPRRFIRTLIFATKADKTKKAKRRKYKLKKGRQKEIGLNTQHAQVSKDIVLSHVHKLNSLALTPRQPTIEWRSE